MPVEERALTLMCFRRRKGEVIDVSLETPEQIRILQRKLYSKAKNEPNWTARLRK
jgi:hypothetical protein